MPSPASPVHRGGVCDPSLSFRTAIADIYNSVTGLSLHDISGKSHGWALSKHRVNEPQTIPATGLSRMVGGDDNYTVATEFPDSIRLYILAEIDHLSDLQAVAQVNKGFFETYKTHKVRLMRKFLQREYRMQRDSAGNSPHRGGNTEPKMRTRDLTDIRDQPTGLADGDSVISLATNDDDDDPDDDDDDDDLAGIGGAPETPLSSSIQHSNRRLDADPCRYPEDEAHSSGDAASPTTPRQHAADHPVSTSTHVETKTSKPLDAITIHVEEPAMTDEEARRILWPDSIIPESPGPLCRPCPETEGHREKFLVGDPLFTHGLEDKTLVVTGDKQLRSELDVRIGLLKKRKSSNDDRPGSPGNTCRRGS
ncbi:hypothetical protein EsHS_00006786 [Epichloe bromicola]